MYPSPIYEGENNPHRMGDYRGVYCSSGGSCTEDIIFHPGLDMGNNEGTDIFAAAAGVVVFANETDMGFTIIIEHDVLVQKYIRYTDISELIRVVRMWQYRH